MVSGVFSLIYILLVAFAATPYLFLPWGFYAGNFINAILLITISMIQIAAFVPPRASVKSYSNRSSKLLLNSIGELIMH